MLNPLFVRLHGVYLASFMGAAILSVSSCSQVQLSYQLPLSVLTQVRSGEATRSQGGAETILARLTLNTALHIANTELSGLRLKFVLTHDQGVLQQIEVPAERFVSDPHLFWEDLPLGDARLEVSLLDASGGVVSALQKTFVLTEAGQQQVDFGLSRVAGAAETEMTLSYRSSLSESLKGSPEQVRFALPLSLSTSPGSSALTNGSSQSNGSSNLVTGSTDSFKTLDLKLRLVESGQNSLLFVWESPAGVDISHYRLLLEGKVIEENHLLSNYRVQNLLGNTTYGFSVQAVGKDGERFTEQLLSGTTLTGSSSGGGGGGGGGSSSSGGGSTVSPVNNPPVIQTLTATRTTLPAPGYPVGLEASATDELLLSDSAYTWSCADCSDATFNTSAGTASQGVGKNVIWNAPSTPGSYTLMLSVSDGVNTPVTRTQIVVVNQRLGAVIVEGTYQ